MSGHGAGAPLGDQARDTTASPHTGRHRAAERCALCHLPALGFARNAEGQRLCHHEARDCYYLWTVVGVRLLPAEPDEDVPFYAGGMSRREERLADRADDPYRPDHQEAPDV